MRSDSRTRHLFVLGTMAVAWSGVARAQPAPNRQAAPPAPPAPTEPAPAAVAAPPPPTPPPPVEAAPAAPSSPPEAAKAPEPPAAKWYDAIALEAFVDGYASVNYNFPKPQAPAGGFGGNQLRAFDTAQGFALHWAGLNASVAPDPVGGTVSLRLGPAALLYNGTDNAYGLQFVKQAYASWKPGGATGTVTIDFGKYDQPFGSEVADTQYNLNYSRSALYWYAQPLFFTGLRFDWAATDVIDVKLFAANGWNNSVDNNRGKSFGAQLNVKPTADTLIAVGYMGGPEQSDVAITTGTDGATKVADTDAGGNLKHLVDVVVDATVAKSWRFLLNGDYGTETLPTGSVSWYGANLGVKYQVDDVWGLSARGEYFADPDGYTTATAKKGTKLVDGTLTVSYAPSTHLLVRLEQRLDYLTSDGDAAQFQTKVDGVSHTQMTTTLGVVAKTN